jgi:acyl-homoserine-lactone acylase
MRTLRRTFLIPLGVTAAALGCSAGSAQNPELARWERQARDVTITRDDWGIPHVHGKTDADAVFGVIYAQAEDDFNRIETNYLNSTGRLAEAEGESRVVSDLRMKLYIHPDSMRALFAASPDWLQRLMTAWADGLNYYLATHPEVTPKVITRFEPWMPLSFSEGSIGGDIEKISLPRLRAFYAGGTVADSSTPSGDGEDEPTGSNGIAIAPAKTAAGRALLLINPHTSFFFRAEAQMTSDEGLNAYGALTWGQFFIYQGFNERAGWMHTSSRTDNIDEYLETVTRKGDDYTYRYGAEERPVVAEKIVVPFRTDTGMARREFTVYRTHHGPVVSKRGDQWVSVRLMVEPVKALIQSYSRTKTRNLGEFRKTMELHTNSSNNTVFADAEGNIAYFHANFVPRRNPKFDWSKPVDGSDPATEWQGVHEIDESPNVFNPNNGWLFNTNNWPYSAAGADSPKEADCPA